MRGLFSILSILVHFIAFSIYILFVSSLPCFFSLTRESRKVVCVDKAKASQEGFLFQFNPFFFESVYQASGVPVFFNCCELLRLVFTGSWQALDCSL